MDAWAADGGTIVCLGRSRWRSNLAPRHFYRTADFPPGPGYAGLGLGYSLELSPDNTIGALALAWMPLSPERHRADADVALVSFLG